MELLINTGDENEKTGTVMTDVQTAEKRADSQMLEQIDGKLDLLLVAAGKEEG